jgi:hypothetical protein
MKIGIGIGVPFGVVPLVTLAIYFIYGRKRIARVFARRDKELEDLLDKGRAVDLPEVNHKPIREAKPQTHELDSNPVSELPPSSVIIRAPSFSSLPEVVHEMDGGQVVHGPISNLPEAVQPIGSINESSTQESNLSSSIKIDDEEIKQIQREQLRLQERRRRLLELDALDTEDKLLKERMNKRLAELQNRG